ncbi:MAG TPA: quinolinate synthase NadA [Syntrophales bacterium]|nr:quinolinate synthase NadA [Syntrophales bacterium]
MSVTDQIHRLKKERRAVILAHNYQIPEVQDIADFVGDSLGLSIQASRTDAEVIVFCGVHFMAETAKILSPAKKVLLPDKNAGCPMANMITGRQLRALKEQHPGAKVLCYVNTSAEVKAECDLCCTSANAVTMVQKALKDDKEIIFVPDRYLADYVAGQTGRTFIVWNGYCPTHARILPEDILKVKALRPEIIVHPECTPEVRKLADLVASTEGMCRYVKQTNALEIIVGTEIGIIHRLKKENPDKTFYPASEQAVCPNMKLITLEKILWALEDLQPEIDVPQEIATKARRCIERMLEYS